MNIMEVPNKPNIIIIALHFPDYLSGVHDYPDCGIGLILGTGTNGAYLENVNRIKRFYA